jgi:diacylglycerol kinase family enzyme
VYTRHFDLSQHVEIIKAKNVEVHNNDYGWVNIDGEAVKMGNNLKISVNSKNLNIICPHGKKK